MVVPGVVARPEFNGLKAQGLQNSDNLCQRFLAEHGCQAPEFNDDSLQLGSHSFLKQQPAKYGFPPFRHLARLKSPYLLGLYLLWYNYNLV